MTHIYRVGQSVSRGVEAGKLLSPSEIYTVTRLLPSTGDGLQYRIRSESEAHERVVIEHQIRAAGSTKTTASTEPKMS
jgi:hypothetical protein